MDPPHLFAFGFAVDMKAFHNLPEENRVNLDDDPYLFAFMGCIGEAGRLLDALGAHPSERSGFILERKDGFVERATRLFNKAKDLGSSKSNRLTDVIAFGSKEEYGALQAADLLAYEVFSDFRNRLLPKPRGMRYPLKEILRRAPHSVTYYDEAEFARFLISVRERKKTRESGKWA